jgi:hypothetical protein
MAQTGKTEAEKAANTAKDTTDNVAELGKRTADQATDVAREVADRAEDAARRGFQVVHRTAEAALEVERVVARRSAEGTAELGQALIALVSEQTRHNLETWTALTHAVDWDRAARAVDWDRVFQLQGEFLRASMERAAQLTQRYFEVTQAVMASAASAAKDQAKRTA